jgi:hypothetical protein
MPMSVFTGDKKTIHRAVYSVTAEDEDIICDNRMSVMPSWLDIAGFLRHYW